MATERIPLTQPIESRDGTFNKDSFSSNCVFERRDQKREFIKRPGLIQTDQVISVTPPAIVKTQGLTNFNYQASLGPFISIFVEIKIAIINNILYYNYSGWQPVTGNTLSNNNSYLAASFVKTPAISLNEYSLIFHCNGFSSSIYVWNNSTPNSIYTEVTTITNQGQLVYGAVCLDNYGFVGTTTNRIYNSDLGMYTTWNPNNYISFNQTNDKLVAIAKHLNYLVAFGANSTVFFYNANNGPYSPLGVAESYTNETGCANGASIVSTDNTVVWIGTSKTNGFSVYLLDGVSPIKISTPSIDRHLETDGVSKVTSYCYKFNGHTLYVLNLLTSNQTIVYDINEKAWYKWTQYAINSNDQPNPGTYSESYFRPSFCCNVKNIYYGLDHDTSVVYKFDVNTYQDDGQPIYCRTVTDLNDNGTTKRKFFGRLEIIGDKVAATMQVRHTGDDYNTWSNYRSVDLNASRSQMYLSGADRRRAWEFLCTDNVPLRLDGAEIDFRIGEMDQEQNVGGGRYRG
jgi:hypothetical protein